MVELEQRDLEIHLQWFRDELPDADLIAIHFEGRPPVDELEVGGETWRVRRAVSELGLRSIAVDDGGPSVVLTPLRNRQIEDDLKARLGGMQVFDVDIWQRLALVFEATGVDARLRQGEHADAVARTLLRVSDRDVTPVSAGFLDQKTAWKTIQRLVLDQQPVAEELADWLAWGADNHEGVGRLFGSHQELVPALRGWLGSEYGAAGRYVVDLLEQNIDQGAGEAGVGVLATGLALEASFRAKERGHNDEALWLQANLATNDLGDAQLRRFAGEARQAWEVVGDARVAEAVGARLDEILREEGHTNFQVVAACSAISETGWEQRVERFVEAVETMLEEGPTVVDEVRERLDELHDHSAAGRRTGRLERMEVLGALAYRLVRADDVADDLAGLGRQFVRDGSFVDAAREKLTAIDPGSAAREIAEEVVELGLERSDEYNRRFATLLSEELESRTAPRHGVGVQDVIDEVVAPVAAEHPVLFVVLDGLNWAVARWLLFDDTLGRWERWAPADDAGGFRPMYATIPSETKHSRTSLLTGELQTGAQHDERDQFARSLRDAGGVKRLKDAKLFHKKELDAARGGAVGSDVRDAIADEDNRVVGVVVNAVDEQLSGAEQIEIDWTVDAVTPLRSLLELARDRVVVIAGDHGHVWETQSEYQSVGDQAARWRAFADEQVEGEQMFTGPMIEELTGEEQLLAAWSERIRYGRGHRGYHGGASRQEILTPLIGLVHEGLQIDLPGFRALNPAPSWWKLREPPREAEVGEEPEEASAQLDLVEPDKPGVDTSWIEDLLETEVFRRQLERHGSGLAPQFIGRVLAQIHANDDKLSVEELADLMDFPVRRMDRRIPVVREVVNREGYTTLRYNRIEQLIELDRSMLERQFGL